MFGLEKTGYFLRYKYIDGENRRVLAGLYWEAWIGISTLPRLFASIKIIRNKVTDFSLVGC